MKILCLPMHGEVKARNEGLRTRDLHLMQHLSSSEELLAWSRPEPWPSLTSARLRSPEAMTSIRFKSRDIIAPVSLRDRRRWWITSATEFRNPIRSDYDLLVVWNIPGGAEMLRSQSPANFVAVDLLDNWLIHPYFQSIRSAMERAYADLMERADIVYCNSEATLELAQSYKRSGVLMPNGCDAERFNSSNRLQNRLSSHSPIAGYAGKLGSRLDWGLLREVASWCQSSRIRLEIAGKILERSARSEVKALCRLGAEYLGDVPYDLLPGVYQRWAIGLVPHSVGSDEVGGDAIKIYEYAASGHIVVSTPIIGSGRLGDRTIVAERSDFLRTLGNVCDTWRERLVILDDWELPYEHTWSAKARRLVTDAQSGARA
jgi:hypothetical protein